MMFAIFTVMQCKQEKWMRRLQKYQPILTNELAHNNFPATWYHVWDVIKQILTAFTHYFKIVLLYHKWK